MIGPTKAQLEMLRTIAAGSSLCWYDGLTGEGRYYFEGTVRRRAYGVTVQGLIDKRLIKASRVRNPACRTLYLITEAGRKALESK